MSQKTSLFPACYKATPNMAGGETATFRWLVNPLNQTLTGSGAVSQAVNPPTHFSVQMSGHYQEVDGQIRVVAGGSIPGAAINVDLQLDHWGSDGKVDSLSWLANNHYFHDSDLPAEPITCLD